MAFIPTYFILHSTARLRVGEGMGACGVRMNLKPTPLEERRDLAEARL